MFQKYFWYEIWLDSKYVRFQKIFQPIVYEEHIKQPLNRFIFCSDDRRVERKKQEKKNEFNGLNKSRERVCSLNFA